MGDTKLLVVYIVVCALVVVLVVYMFRTYSRCFRENVEHFSDGSESKFYGKSEQDEKVYFDIIDLYRLYLDRDPTEDELDFEFGKIQSGDSSIAKLNYKIKHSMEFIRLKDPNDMSKSESTIVKTEDDVEIVRDLLRGLVPDESVDEIGAEQILFLVSKFNDMKRDMVAFEEYYKSLPEYADHCAIVKRQREATARLNASGPSAVVDGEGRKYFTGEVEEEEGYVYEEGVVEEEERDEEYIDMRALKDTDGFERGGQVVSTRSDRAENYDTQDFTKKNSITSFMIREPAEEDVYEYGAEISPMVSVGDGVDKMDFEIRRPNINERGTLRVAGTEKAKALMKRLSKVSAPPSILLSKNKLTEAEKDTSTCSFYKEFNRLRELDPLSMLVNTRNMDELKFHCDNEQTA